MDTTTTNDVQELKTLPAVLELKQIQEDLGLPDNDFARVVKFAYSGSSWGKIKNGTFSGNPAKGAAAVKSALAKHRLGGDELEVRGKNVVFDFVQAAIDAVTVVRGADEDDEHKLVVVVGASGSGKTTTARILVGEFGGKHFHAKPSWGNSYLRALLGFAEGIGLNTDYRSVGEAETGILAALKQSPMLLLMDEANHFCRDFINFCKTILNETACALVIFTLPLHLSRMAATNSEESRQLLRRAEAIIQIPPVNSAQVMAVHSAFFSGIHLGTSSPGIASVANRHCRMDTVIRIFQEADPENPNDLTAAIERVEKSVKTQLVA